MRFVSWASVSQALPYCALASGARIDVAITITAAARPAARRRLIGGLLEWLGCRPLRLGAKVSGRSELAGTRIVAAADHESRSAERFLLDLVLLHSALVELRSHRLEEARLGD